MYAKLTLTAVLAALAVSGCRRARPSARTFPREVTAALKEIETPSEPLWLVNMPPTNSEAERQQHIAVLAARRSHDAMMTLKKTDTDVSAALLAIARSKKGLGPRYRAAWVLALRGDRRAIRVLNWMVLSKDPAERQLAWDAYSAAVSEGKLRPGMDVAAVMRFYRQEKNGKVRDNIERFLGETGAGEAVPLLMKRVAENPGYACSAVWALGMIGDPAAVPVLKKSCRVNTDYYLTALARIGTPESVKFVVSGLNKHGSSAADALVHVHPRIALPALKRYLAKKPKDALDRSAARIAIVRLSEKDPRDRLMKLVEDVNEERQVRWDASATLRIHYDTKPYEKRFLAVYEKEKLPERLLGCIWVLKDSQVPGVTEAMIEHALVHKRTYGKNDIRNALRRALGRRLGRRFATFKELQEYLRKRRAKRPRPDSVLP